MKKTDVKFLVLIIPPDRPCRLAHIGRRVESMDSIVEHKRAKFDYYDGVIIGENAFTDGLKRNEHITGRKVYGTCYLIGNYADDDFRSLTLDEINRLFPKYL